MKLAWIACFALIVLLGACVQKGSVNLDKFEFPKVDFPKAMKRPHLLTLHGDDRIDNYFWMKDRENPEVIAYLEAENKATERVLAPVKTLEEKLFQEMKKRTREDESSVPVKKENYEYWTQFVPGGQYPIFFRRRLDHLSQGNTKAHSTEAEVIFDGNLRAQGLDFFQTTSPIMSPKQDIMAIGIDSQGRRFFDFEFKNLVTSNLLKFKLKKITANLIWAADNKTVFYVQQDPNTLRADRVYRANVLTGKIELVYTEKDPTFDVHISHSVSKKFIYLHSSSTLSSEVRFIDASAPMGEFHLFLAREKDHEYDVEDGVDRFYIISNWQAPNFRVFELPIPQTSQLKKKLGPFNKDSWREIIPHRTDTLITGLTVFKNHLVVSEKSMGLDQIHVFSRQSLSNYLIPFSDQSYSAEVHSATEYASEKVRYDFESLRLPASTFDYDLNSRESILLKTKDVPTYNPELYKTERVWIQTKDGEKVPVSLLMKRNFKPEGKNPLLIYGYGAYGLSSDANFNQSIVSLIDRGFVYAIAHIRGGSELGRRWYDQGRVLKKKNSFDDFIACTERLLKLNYADSRRVYAMGGSAGGLLMGAVMNQRPDLYRGIVAAVPFVDVVTTMLDDSIPLTTSEYDEWGNPNEKTYYYYIRSYSPYDNVGAKTYPHLLVTTGLHDSQVQYWEPAKWVAKLRDQKSNNNLILLKTNMGAGHGGPSGRYERLKEEALEFSFLLMIDAGN